VDRDRYVVRPFEAADYEVEARINAAYDPTAATAEETRHWVETEAAEPGHVNVAYVAQEREPGVAVAYARLNHTSSNFHPKKFWVSAHVDPAYAHQGIGSHLYALLEERAVALGAIALWSGYREDHAPSARFFDRHGFTAVRKSWQSRLALADAGASVPPDRSGTFSARGITFTTLANEGAARPEVRRRVYELSRLGSADAPRLGAYTPVSFERFVGTDLDTPRALPEAYFLARREDQYVGMTTLERMAARPDSLLVGFTCTHPEFRGLGIAVELKRRSVAWARAHGYRFLVTTNDSLNARMWAINERLGFRRETTWVLGEKPMPGHAPIGAA
jgi:mycothiol synthase